MAEEGKPILPEPKLVVDKNPQGVRTMKARRGELRDKILEIVGRTDPGGGVTIESVAARLGKDQTQTGIALANMTQAGWLIRPNPGRYSVNPTPPTKKTKRAAPEYTAPAPLTIPSEISPEDLETISKALDALAAMEKLVRKHMELARQFAAFKNLFMGGSNG
jgi:hypothetical protein